MTLNTEEKLTLYQPAIYEIKVPGLLDESWSGWVEGMTIEVDAGDGGQPVSILRGAFDQAALQ